MISLRQMKNDGSSNIKGYAQKIESLMFQAATANYPEYWEDDIITLTLIKGLAGMFNGQDLLVPGNIIRSRWTSYIMRGDFDNRMADIGLLISIRYHDGNTVQGIAAIKAAVKDRDRNTFSSIKKDHIKKLNTAFHHSQVLLYDYDHITRHGLSGSARGRCGKLPHELEQLGSLYSRSVGIHRDRVFAGNQDHRALQDRGAFLIPAVLQKPVRARP